MRVVAAIAAMVSLLLCVPVLIGPGASAGSPGMAAAAAAEPDALGSGIVLTIDALAPRVVTADGPSVLTVTGTLTNAGTSPVTDLVVRVQRSDPLGTEAGVREALAGQSPVDAVAPQFTALPGELAPGASLPIRLTVPLTGPDPTSIALTQAGVHALLVNVNGASGGVRARLAAARTLLPVLSLPGGERLTGAAGPVPVTVLYPIADVPHRLPTVPGEPTTLTDDDLASSFANGRLAGLVDALAAAAPAGSPQRTGICVAVDPDLIATAAAMAGGYEVRTPGQATTVPGTGAEAARAWLTRLREAVRGGCVLALAHSDADLVALVRSGASDLAQRAVVDGRQIVEQELGTTVLPDTIWPADGLIDEATVADVATSADGSPAALVLSADGLVAQGTRHTSGVVEVAGRRQLALLTDPLLTLAATGPRESARTGAGIVTSESLAGSGPLGTQDAIGALAFRAVTRSAGEPGPLVLAPPHRWTIDRAAAGELLDALSRMTAQRLIEPRALGAALAAGPADRPAQRLFYPTQAGAVETPPSAVAALLGFRDDIERLRAAADYEPGVGAPLDAVFDPLLLGILRGASAAQRAPLGSAAAPETAQREVDLVGQRIHELVGSVRVLDPPGVFSLGTQSTPLPLTIANGLPVTMTVRVELASSSGLRVAPIPVQRVPPLGRVQVRVSAEVLRAGQFTVEAAVRTPDGGPLGDPTRLRVRSTVYGTVTIWLTAVAGALLVLLAARRVIRRLRSGDDQRRTGDTPPTKTDPPEAPSPEGRVPHAVLPRARNDDLS